MQRHVLFSKYKQSHRLELCANEKMQPALHGQSARRWLRLAPLIRPAILRDFPPAPRIAPTAPAAWCGASHLTLYRPCSRDASRARGKILRAVGKWSQRTRWLLTSSTDWRSPFLPPEFPRFVPRVILRQAKRAPLCRAHAMRQLAASGRNISYLGTEAYIERRLCPFAREVQYQR